VRRVLVSGISSHIGRVLGAQLVADGFDVHGLSRQASPQPPLAAESIPVHRVDGQTSTLMDVVREVNPHAVIHLAGLVLKEHDASTLAPLIEANILFGAQLLESMRACGCTRIITAGTYLQHADSDAYRALNLYAATKQAFESLLEYYAHAFDFSALRLTVCNVYSEHEIRPSLMTDIAAAWKNQAPLVVRDRDVRVDLVHADDVARCFVRAVSMMEGRALPTGRLSKYSVTSGRDYSPEELVQVFEEVGERKLSVRFLQPSGATRRPRPWRGEAIPGWVPHVSIHQGVARIIENSPTPNQHVLQSGKK
jgi:nucleoside-diphosphate-sugar epimerase